MLCWCLPLVVFHIPLATWIVQLSTSVPTDLLEDLTFGRRCEHHQWSPPKPRPEYRHSCPSRNHTPCCKWVWNYQQWYSKRKISTWDTMNISPILGIGFLQQSRPELIWVFGVNKDESPIDCWKLIINDNIHPFSKSPKLWWWERREWIERRTDGIKCDFYHLHHELLAMIVRLPWSGKSRSTPHQTLARGERLAQRWNFGTSALQWTQGTSNFLSKNGHRVIRKGFI